MALPTLIFGLSRRGSLTPARGLFPCVARG